MMTAPGGKFPCPPCGRPRVIPCLTIMPAHFPERSAAARAKFQKLTLLCYYRRTFTIDPEWKGRQVFLHFGAAKAALEVYVNGQFVGYSQGSMTPHEFDVTRYLLNGENLVCAKVYRYSDGSYLEDQDMWWLCGIYREAGFLFPYGAGRGFSGLDGAPGRLFAPVRPHKRRLDLACRFVSGRPKGL